VTTSAVAECINSSNLNENVNEYYDNNDEDDNNIIINNIDDNNNNKNNDDDDHDDDDDDYANPVSPLLSASKRKRLIATGVKKMTNLPSSNCDTLAFLGGYKSCVAPHHQTTSGGLVEPYRKHIDRKHIDINVQVMCILLSHIAISWRVHCICHHTILLSVVILITDNSIPIFMEWQSQNWMDHPQCPTWS